MRDISQRCISLCLSCPLFQMKKNNLKKAQTHKLFWMISRKWIKQFLLLGAVFSLQRSENQEIKTTFSHWPELHSIHGNRAQQQVYFAINNCKKKMCFPIAFSRLLVWMDSQLLMQNYLWIPFSTNFLMHSHGSMLHGYFFIHTAMYTFYACMDTNVCMYVSSSTVPQSAKSKDTQ